MFDYCSTMYFIDSGMTEKLIESGRQATVGNPFDYMRLAIEFWERQ
ncbi:MAG: hypothetical protein IJ087_04740 [Eggerthellaceae bacterium]|nr:hypothetical protein [Eggerthellaceae bacterium]